MPAASPLLTAISSPLPSSSSSSPSLLGSSPAKRRARSHRLPGATSSSQRRRDLTRSRRISCATGAASAPSSARCFPVGSGSRAATRQRSGSTRVVASVTPAPRSSSSFLGGGVPISNPTIRRCGCGALTSATHVVDVAAALVMHPILGGGSVSSEAAGVVAAVRAVQVEST
jgi:hypothetical protein